MVPSLSTFQRLGLTKLGSEAAFLLVPASAGSALRFDAVLAILCLGFGAGLGSAAQSSTKRNGCLALIHVILDKWALDAPAMKASLNLW